MCVRVQSVDSVDEAVRLREVSEQLRDRAVSTAKKIEEGLTVSLSSLNATVTFWVTDR